MKSFEHELDQLRGLITDMGGMVERQTALAAAAVREHDAEAAEQAIAADPEVDALERACEQFVIRLLALRQPLAQDLRQIVAALKISGELERIGDYAKNVAKRSLVLARLDAPFATAGIGHMAELVQENLKAVIDAFGAGDAEQALAVWRSDQAIDDLYNALFRELITYMMEDARAITPCTHLLFIAKNLERIGDHATNIAEMIYYAARGEPLPEDRPKGGAAGYAAQDGEA